MVALSNSCKESANMLPCPRVVFVGGPDVDMRIPLMKALRSEFDLVAVGSNRHLSMRFEQSNFHFFGYPLNRGIKPLGDLKTLSALTLLFRRLRPDIVHTFDTKPCVWGRLAARLVRVPIVVGTLPGLGSLYTTNSTATQTVRHIYEQLQRLACHLSDATVFQNKEDLRQFVDRGIVPAMRAYVIPGSGVSTYLFDPIRVPLDTRAQLRGELGISQKALVVTMISRAIRSKGIMEFAEAAAFVSANYRDAVFLLVGPDDHASVDRLTTAEMERVTRHVIWLGKRQDIATILSITDVFVLPSYYREGIPRVLLEAASMGLPIVTTNSPGCNEVVEQGVNGFLVPPRTVEPLAKAILRLLADPGMRRRFGQASRHRAVTRFDLSIVAQEIAILYRKLLTEKGLLQEDIVE